MEMKKIKIMRYLERHYHSKKDRSVAKLERRFGDKHTQKCLKELEEKGYTKRKKNDSKVIYEVTKKGEDGLNKMERDFEKEKFRLLSFPALLIGVSGILSILAPNLLDRIITAFAVIVVVFRGFIREYWKFLLPAFAAYFWSFLLVTSLSSIVNDNYVVRAELQLVILPFILGGLLLAFGRHNVIRNLDGTAFGYVMIGSGTTMLVGVLTVVGDIYLKTQLLKIVGYYLFFYPGFGLFLTSLIRLALGGNVRNHITEFIHESSTGLGGLENRKDSVLGYLETIDDRLQGMSNCGNRSEDKVSRKEPKGK